MQNLKDSPYRTNYTTNSRYKWLLKNNIRQITTIVLFLIFGNFAKGNNNEFLKFNYNCSNSHSGFDKVNIIDKRAAKQLLGLVQLGGFNRMEQLKFQGSFTDSLAKYFLNADTSIKNGRELTIILYEFFASEKADAMSETGRLKFSLRFFENLQPSKFEEVLMVDSVYLIQGGDATKKLLRSISERLCEISAIVSKNKYRHNDSLPTYSHDDLFLLDSLEKLKLPIYNTENFNEGVFIDYQHFKNNITDNSKITFDTTVNGKMLVYRWDEIKKKKIKLKIGSFYAACDGKTIVKSTSIGLYNLEKIGFDFFYNGKTSFFSTANNAALMGVMFGLTGLALSSAMNNQEQLFHLKINYLSGHSIPISLPKYQN